MGTALIILDGWGLAPEGPGNCVRLASTPVVDRLEALLVRLLAGAGEAGQREDLVEQVGEAQRQRVELGLGLEQAHARCQ